MRDRSALVQGTTLTFPSFPCVVERETGRGSNAIVYKGWYADSLDPQRRHHVLIKELFPYHKHGAIYRDPDTLFVCRAEQAQALFALHKQSFMWGNDIHLRLRERYPSRIGGNINTYQLNDTYYTLLDFTDGRTLEGDLKVCDAQRALRTAVKRMIGVLESLSIFHEMGFLHLDISPDNILLIERDAHERIELIDYNSVVRLSDIRRGEAPLLSMKQGYASPEVRSHDVSRIGEWTDFYSVAAVFFRCLTGQTLSLMQISGIVPVDIGSASCMQNVPETVKSLTQHIVKKGLSTIVHKRYQTASAMLADLSELLDRIDGVGVTHWALWEAASQNIHRIVRANPSLTCLTDDSAYYPMKIDASECGVAQLLKGGRSAMLTGDGGMGKTTFLLHTAWQENQRYRSERPVVLYLSLYGAKAKNDGFIINSILQRLRFKPDTGGYEDARHALGLLLQETLHTPSGDLPVLCLLLDGYNEVTEDASALGQEIAGLRDIPGVRMLVASRNAVPELSLEEWRLCPLTEKTIANVLTSNGLLMPEAPQVRTLLANPMMLNLFISACLDSGRQLTIQTCNELVNAYLDALLSKEISALPEDSPEKWRLEAAVRYVYPMAAGLETRKNRGVTSVELAALLRTLYKLLRKRSFGKLFPQWIGHTSEIRGEAKDSDEWFGVMIHELLWRRMGLLYRDENGAYRIIHQELREALLPKEKVIHAYINKRRTVCTMAGALFCAGIVAFSLWTAPYNAQVTIDLLSCSQSLYREFNGQLEHMQGLLLNDAPDDNAISFDSFEAFTAEKDTFESVRSELETSFVQISFDRNGDADIVPECSEMVNKLYDSGHRLPWSNRTFDGGCMLNMVRFHFNCRQRYLEYLQRLEYVYAHGTPEQYAHFRGLIADILEKDAYCMAAYEQIVYLRPVEGMLAWEGTVYGNASRGAYNRVDSLRSGCQWLNGYANEEWNGWSAERMLTELNQRKDVLLEARSALAGDSTYQRLVRRNNKE